MVSTEVLVECEVFFEFVVEINSILYHSPPPLTQSNRSLTTTADHIFSRQHIIHLKLMGQTDEFGCAAAWVYYTRRRPEYTMSVAALTAMSAAALKTMSDAALIAPLPWVYIVGLVTIWKVRIRYQRRAQSDLFWEYNTANFVSKRNIVYLYKYFSVFSFKLS